MVRLNIVRLEVDELLVVANGFQIFSLTLESQS